MWQKFLISLVLAALDKIWGRWQASRKIEAELAKAIAESDDLRKRLAEAAQLALDATKDMSDKTPEEQIQLRKERRDALKRLIQR